MPSPAAQTLVNTVTDLLERGSPVVTLHELSDVPGLLSRVEARTHQRLWNAQRDVRTSMHRLTWELDHRIRARRLDERAIVSSRGSARNPLLTTLEPNLRVGPVSYPLLVADSTFALLSVMLPPRGETGHVGTEDPDLVAMAEAAFLEGWEQSVSSEEAGLLPPLPDRRFRIAVLLVDGHTDQEISDEVGVSTRTVSQEVRAIVDWLGARNRTHAVAMLVGAA